MKATLIALAAAGGLFLAGPTIAQSGADILKAKGCENCHALDTKKVGPAFKEVAAKNKDKKGAAEAIIAKLKDDKGHMKVNASEAEIKTAVTYVLGLK